MDISTLLSGAGQVSTGVREREEELRRAQLQRLTVQEANRRAQTERAMTGLQLPELGSFGPDREAQPVGVRPKPVAAAPAAPAVAAPAAGVTINKPAASVVNTVGYQQGIAENVKDPRQLTREQFLQLSPQLQKQIYEDYASKITLANSRERDINLSVRDRNPQAPRPVSSMEDFIAGLPQRSGPANKRGRAPKAGVTTPGGAKIQNASQYDKPTAYDGLIEQSAARYGLDPVVFKRLLGTESSFDPNAVSPRGKDFGLGIGQIASSWGLSDAQRLDPNVAIPKAAEILATYVQAAGGDYQEAMMRYKGASSEKGRASMAPIINGILGGGADGAVATLAAEGPALREAIAAGGQRPAGGQRLPAQAPTYDPEYTQTRSPAQFYLANPGAVSQDIRAAMMQRDELVRMAKLYQQGGMGMEYTQLRQQILQLDQQMAGLAGIQAVQQMEYSNDPRELSKMLSYVQGQQIDLKPYTDGSFDIFINGQLAHENVSGDQIKHDALSLFDPSYREKVASRAEETHKSRLKLSEKVAELQITGFNQLNLATLNGNVQIAVEQLKQRGKGRFDIKPLGDGSIAITPLDGSHNGVPFVWSPEGRTVTIDGEDYTVNNAQPIAGLR